MISNLSWIQKKWKKKFDYLKKYEIEVNIYYPYLIIIKIIRILRLEFW